MFSSVQFSHSVVSNSLRPHESQHARSPCPSPTPAVHSDSCPLSQWCHPAISSSVIPFSSCPQSLLASESFPMSQFFAWGGQSIGVSEWLKFKTPASVFSGDLLACWEGLGAGGKGDHRGWDGWMASLTQWTWAWVNSGSWWWTGRPGVLRFMGSQRVGHDWANELNWTEVSGVALWWVAQIICKWDIVSYLEWCTPVWILKMSMAHLRSSDPQILLCSAYEDLIKCRHWIDLLEKG